MRANTMRRKAQVAALVCVVIDLMLLTISANAQRSEKGVRVVKNVSWRRVDVLVDGQPFTSYIWPETLTKPVLYPLRTAQGTIITRGFPLDPRPGERVDHPHHVGLWLDYGNVNGVDFWNNSIALPPEQQKKMGTVVHRRITRASGGKDRGQLDVEMEWVMPDGQPILREATTFVFHAGPNLRAVEQPSNEPLVFTDTSGRPTAVKVMNNDGVTGLYRSSEGKTGDAVWGTRARWTMLTGKVDQESITLVILDHPKNMGFPTYWHARGYGLFAANPLGQEVFSNGREKLIFTLEPKQSVTFRYRLLILSDPTTPDKVEEQYRRFVNEVK